LEALPVGAPHKKLIDLGNKSSDNKRTPSGNSMVSVCYQAGWKREGILINMAQKQTTKDDKFGSVNF